MRITIVMGFFLPVPPVAGGAIEKTWHRLAAMLAERGHEITLISRAWRGWQTQEQRDGVRYLRLPGHRHQRRLAHNLLLDLAWSLRVTRHLPPADILVCNAVTLPCWLGWLRPACGRVIALPGRMPKGQYRVYTGVAAVLAPSGTVRTAVLTESQRWADRVSVVGYPIDWTSLAHDEKSSATEVRIGYVGRLHREKGVHLLAAALAQLAHMGDLPPWRGVIRGPSATAEGGSGPLYHDELLALLPANTELCEPVYHEAELHECYRQIDVFCYPSLAARGETFGVAVAEAMAAGAVPVVSDLPCFDDFITHDVNGEVFPATAPDAVSLLANALAGLIRDTARRERLAKHAQETVRRYDFAAYTDRLVLEFGKLL